MKKPLLLLPAFLLILSFCINTQAQVQEWQSIQNFPDARSSAVSFVIGETAYVGTGYDRTNYLKSFYKYTATNDTWSAITDFPGVGRENAVAFVADGKAYVGTGTDGNTQLKDFYEYDPSTGSWTAISDLPGAIRDEASCFSINSKGYVGLGGNGTGSLNDFYEFDPATGNWTAIASLPASEARSKAVGYGANGKGYIVSGSGSIQFTGMYSYDPIADSWSEEIFADSKLSSLQQNTAYTDADGLVHILKFGFTKEQVVIDPSDNTLTTEDAYFTDERNAGVAFYLNGEAYAGLGLVYDGFGDAVEQNGFRKLVSPEEPEPTEPPNAPSNLILSTKKTNTIFWEDNSDNEEGFNIYLSKDTNNNYEKIGTTVTDTETFAISGLQRDTKYFVKAEAFNEGGIAESNEINFYGRFKNGKLNRPELLTIFNRKISFGSQYLVFENRDQRGTIEVERSINNQNYKLIDDSYTGETYGKIDTITFYENYPDNITSIDYRIRLTADNRIPSEYSESYSIDLTELKPESGKIIFDEYENSWSEKEFIEPTVNFEDYINSEDILVYRIENDTIQFLDTANYQWSTQVKFREGEKVNLFTINTNVFGADTSEVFSFQIPLRTPAIGKARSAGEIAVGFSFFTNSFISKYSVIQKSIDGVSFIDYDSIEVNHKNFDDNIRYIDKDIEPNQTYYYRVKNISEKAESYSESNTVGLKATDKNSWLPFRKKEWDILVQDSSNIYPTNIKYHEGKIFLLSGQTSSGKVYDLGSKTFEKLPEIPTDAYGRFNDVEIIGNKLFCIGNNDGGKFSSTIWIYDMDKSEWSTKDLSNKFSNIYNAFPISNNELLLSVYETRTYIGGLAKYIIDKDTVVECMFRLRDIITYSEVMGDSIRLFGRNNKEYIVDKNLTFKRLVALNKGELDYLSDDLITEYKGQKIQLSNKSIYEVNTNKARKLKLIGGYNLYRDNYTGVRSFSFVHNDTLVFYPAHLDFGKFKINHLYYKSYSAPKPVQIVDGFEGYNKIDLQWSESKNVDGYILKYKGPYYTSVSDSLFLEADIHAFEITNLPGNTKIEVSITPYSKDVSGEPVNAVFHTLNPKPIPPIITSIKQESGRGVELSWELQKPYILVEGLSLNGIEIETTGPSQMHLIEDYEENKRFTVALYALNQNAKSNVIYSDTILTRLYSPKITEVAYFEKEGKYQVVINDSSAFETSFNIYRKTSEKEEFELLQIVQGNQPNHFTIDDFIDDANVSYEYYVQSYLVENDSILNSSFPSNIASTDNAVLSNTPLQSDELSIFPNPVADHISISSSLNIQLQQIQVLSLEGRLLKTFEASETIDVSELEKGIYLLKIKAKSGEVIKRFIKE